MKIPGILTPLAATVTSTLIAILFATLLFNNSSVRAADSAPAIASFYSAQHTD